MLGLKRVMSPSLGTTVKTHARIQEFSSGGVQASLPKKALTFFFFYGSQMVNLNKIYHFSRFQRGPTFSRGGGGPIFSRGVQLLIPYRNPYYL